MRTPLADRRARRRSPIRCARSKVEALAISFLNSYLTPEHEQAAARELRRLLPDVFVTTGTELTREWHEFERTATAAANAYVGPQVSKYIAEFDAGLRSGGFNGSLLLMGSHGGVISAERGCREPITLVESGPVGGCIGAASYGHLLGVDNLVAFDMGGTTAKCAMIERGRYAVESIYHIGGPDAGFPIRGNVIDILEVGVGGGSIAWLDDQRRLNVGPRSAGSMPGRPATAAAAPSRPSPTPISCSAASIPSNFLGGEMQLAADKARDVLARRIAEPLGYSGDDAVTRAAKGVLTIANLTMSSIIKKVSIARGYDPRDFALFCYGGGGPLHGIELARALNIPRVIVPPEPGNFSAVGMLLADPRLDTAQTFVVRLNPENLAKVIGDLCASWRRRAAAALRREFGDGTITIEREAEMRYKGQHHSIKIPLADSDDARRLARALRPGISAALRPRQCGGRGRDRRAAFARDPAHEAAGHRPSRQAGERPARRRSWRRGRSSSSRKIASCRRRSMIAMRSSRASTGSGPALIVEYGSSTLIGPRDTFTIGKLGEIDIDCSH